MNFMDANDFDVRAVKILSSYCKQSIQMIPFQTMNLFYRDGKIKEIREQWEGVIIFGLIALVAGYWILALFLLIKGLFQINKIKAKV